VDEQGTEAAAATAVALDESASVPVTLSFDRPFLFAVYDQPTGQVLFFGRGGNRSATAAA
jgi:serpin B